MNPYATHLTLTGTNVQLKVPFFDHYVATDVDPLDESRKQILKQELLRDLNDPDFTLQIVEDLALKRDVIFESHQTQVGKTKLLLTLVWLLKHDHGRLPVVVLDNKLDDISQLQDRARNFNEFIHSKLEAQHLYRDKSFELNFLEVKGTTTERELEHAAQRVDPLILTIHPARYRRLFDLITAAGQRKLTLIYDEADQSVGSIKTTPVQEKEVLSRRLLKEYPEIPLLYITATPFAVENSEERTGCRNIVVRIVPETMYAHHGLEYRDFYHHTNVRHNAPCLDALRDWTNCPEETKEEFLTLLEPIVATPLSATQPNIVLLNIAFKNEPKFDIATYLFARFGTRARIVVYTGEGGIEAKTEEGYRSYDQPFIGSFLQYLKDQGNIQPILILATGLATRAQTYKSTDNQWKLTHFFLSLAEGATMETIIQSLRGNGQYRADAPPLHLYLSQPTEFRIYYALCNKMLITTQLLNKAGVKPREELTRTMLLASKYRCPFSRPEIDDTVFTDAQGSYHGIAESEEELARQIELFTRIHRLELPRIQLTSFYNDIPYTVISDLVEGRDDLRNLPASVQSQIRTRLLAECRQRGHIGPGEKKTLQVAYYGERARILNKLNLHKPASYHADIIALNPLNKQTVPVVVYRRQDTPVNSILLWHTTEGYTCFYVHREDEASLPRFAGLEHRALKEREVPDTAPRVRKEEAWLQYLERITGLSIVRQHVITIPETGKQYRADGFNAEHRLIFEFYGDYYHGNPAVYAAGARNDKVGRTFGELYQETLARERELKAAGYHIFRVWERDYFHNQNGSYVD